MINYLIFIVMVASDSGACSLWPLPHVCVFHLPRKVCQRIYVDDFGDGSDDYIKPTDVFLRFFLLLLLPPTWAPTSTSSWGSSGRTTSSPSLNKYQIRQHHHQHQIHIVHMYRNSPKLQLSILQTKKLKCCTQLVHYQLLSTAL